MLTLQQWREARDRACTMLNEAGLVLTTQETETLEVADFGLGRLGEIGLEVVVYVNTTRVCAKELVMFPWQICPEHKHPPVGAALGKEETFRCRWGEVRLYVEGEAAERTLAVLPSDREAYFTVKHEIVLRPGEQYTLFPNTLHWFQAGPQGSIVSEFSTRSTDEHDLFTDPDIARAPVVQ